MTTRAALLSAATLFLAATQVSAQEASTSAPSANKAPICDNYRQVMASAEFPREALDLNLDAGRVVVEFTLTADDQVTNVRTVTATHPAFSPSSEQLVAKLKCKSWGKEAIMRVPFQYQVAY